LHERGGGGPGGGQKKVRDTKILTDRVYERKGERKRERESERKREREKERERERKRESREREREKLQSWKGCITKSAAPTPFKLYVEIKRGGDAEPGLPFAKN